MVAECSLHPAHSSKEFYRANTSRGEYKMDNFIQFVGPTQAVEIAGVKLVGMNAENGKKLLFTLAFFALLALLSLVLRALARLVMRGRENVRLQFWTQQAIRLVTALVFVIGVVSIWFNDPARLATAVGLVTAGLAFALQKVITALAGYFVILRGHTFNVGDRITMGGVRGDVIALGFIQTTIMEMGQPPAVQSDEPAMWVRSRQYTGRIVTVTNDKIFEEPVYNYTREFPYIWEEMQIWISFTADRDRAERILLEAAEGHTVQIERIAKDDLQELKRRYLLRSEDIYPAVYWRLTSNWLELTLRFLVHTHGVRETKNEMTRQILARLDEAGIGIASTTFEVVGLPEVRIRSLPRGQAHKHQQA